MHSDRVRLAMADIIRHAELAIEFLDGKSLSDMVADQRTYMAVSRCLEIVSEASRRVSDDVKQQYPHIPWRQVADAGNFYRHVYDQISPEYVLETVRRDLPVIISAMQDAVAKLK